MQVPSGRIYHNEDLKILHRMQQVGFVRYAEKPFTLKSGIRSHVYVFGREDLTDNPDLEHLLGQKIARDVWMSDWCSGVPQVPCLIGIPTAGTALAQAAAMMDYHPEMGRFPICHRIMREALKEHGAHKGWVNGKPREDHQYWLVDNVATDGKSKLEAREKLAADGYPVDDIPCFILVDRQQGAIENLRKAGFQRILVGYFLLDITFAFGELGLWPKETVKTVEREIEEHRALQQTKG